MHIAIVFEFGTLNGGENSILATLDVLRGREPHDWQFSAIAPPAGRLATALHARGIPHIPLAWRDADGQRLPRDVLHQTLREAIGRTAPDLVHANSLAAGRVIGALAHELPVPCLAHLRDILRLSRAAVADLNRNARLIAVSAATARFHIAQGIEPNRITVAHTGVDHERFAPRPATGSLRQELGLPDDAFLTLTIGQIGLRKRQDVLAEAAVRLGDRLPHLHCVVVGERHSSKEESRRFERELDDRFASAGMADRLHRTGWRDDIPRLMNEADLLVHPAAQEPLGRVLLEAAASGLPVVATDVGGTAEIFTDGDSGRLIPAGDPAALAAAILELHNVPTLRAQFAANAREVILSRFTALQAADRLRDVWMPFRTG